MEYATGAYEAYGKALSTSEEIDIPLIGEDCMAWSTTYSDGTSYVITRRHHEAILELDYLGIEDIGIDGLARLAQIVQSRLEE